MATVQSTALVTDLASPPDATQTFYHRTLLERAEYYNYHMRWASPRPLSARVGKNIIFRRYLHLAIALSPLSEGVAPSGKTPTLDDFTVALKQFGDFIALSDFAAMTQIDDLGTHWSGLLGEQAGYTMDAVSRDVSIAGTTIVYSNGTARTDINSIVDANDLDRAIRTLNRNGAQYVLKGNQGSTTIGSAPIRDAYAGVTHPDVIFDLQNVTGYKDASEYKGAVEGEVGRYRQLAFFSAHDGDSLNAGSKLYNSGGATSSLVRNTSGTVNVYTIMVFAKNYLTEVPFGAKSVQMIRKPLGSAGTADPLDQVSTMGWKNTSARVRTNESWGLRIEIGASL